MSIQVKDNSIKIHGIAPELLFGLIVADQVYTEIGVDLVVTSLNDGRHSSTSLHYSGAAADLRTRNIPAGIDPKDVAADIKERLGIDFDVICESDHIHLEYQPRRRA